MLLIRKPQKTTPPTYPWTLFFASLGNEKFNQFFFILTHVITKLPVVNSTIFIAFHLLGCLRGVIVIETFSAVWVFELEQQLKHRKKFEFECFRIVMNVSWSRSTVVTVCRKSTALPLKNRKLPSFTPNTFVAWILVAFLSSPTFFRAFCRIML